MGLIGSPLNVLHVLPWPWLTPHHWGGSAQLRGRGRKWERQPETQARRSHLGNGPGAAAPGVQHDRVLVSFFQHLILKEQRGLSREKLHPPWMRSPAPLSPLHCPAGRALRETPARLCPALPGLWNLLFPQSPNYVTWPSVWAELT